MSELDRIASELRSEYISENQPYRTAEPWDELPEYRRERWRQLVRRAAELLGVEDAPIGADEN